MWEVKFGEDVSRIIAPLLWPVSTPFLGLWSLIRPKRYTNKAFLLLLLL